MLRINKLHHTFTSINCKYFQLFKVIIVTLIHFYIIKMGENILVFNVNCFVLRML